MVEGLQVNVLKVAVARKNHLELDVVVHALIDSTNDWCLQQHKVGRVMPFACFAEEQTSGKGRRGKHWVGAAKSNLAMSIAWSFVLSEQPLHLLPLSVAIAIAQTLEHFGLQQVQIKWPNDVYVQGRKIAGILIETQPDRIGAVKAGSEKVTSVAVVIGVGLNYDMSGYDMGKTEAELVLTDICEQVVLQEISPLPERQEVASVLLSNMVSVCHDFQQSVASKLELFRARYDYCKGKNVEIVLDNKVSLSGVAQGVNENAELSVLIEGELQVFNSAEVSVIAGSGESSA